MWPSQKRLTILNGNYSAVTQHRELGLGARSMSASRRTRYRAMPFHDSGEKEEQ